MLRLLRLFTVDIFIFFKGMAFWSKPPGTFRSAEQSRIYEQCNGAYSTVILSYQGNFRCLDKNAVEAAKKFYGRNYVSDRTTTVLSCPMDAFPQSVYEVIFGAFGNVDVKPRKNSLDRFYFGFIYEDNRFVISVPVTGVDDITNMAYIQVDGVANAASNAEKLEQEAKVDHAGRVLSAWISGSGNWVFEKKNAD